MFERLCGSFAKVVLTTTMWGEVSLEAGQRREVELTSKFWKAMIDNGATVDRLKATEHDEAWRIVDYLIAKRTKTREAVLLQKELVDLERKLNETEAARALYASIPGRVQDERKAIYAVHKHLNGHTARADESRARILKVEEAAVESKLPLGKRIQKFSSGLFGR